MLSKKDLDQIRIIIQEELKAAFTIEIQYEKYDKEKGMKELKIEERFLPEWLVDLQPYLIGALRGMQEDCNKVNNKSIGIIDNIKALSQIMIDNENVLKCLASISDRTKEISSENIVKIGNNKSLKPT